MKICFLLQRRFAHVGHAIAVALKERYGIKDFCGYVYLRSNLAFLKSQKEIRYTELLLDENTHKQYKNEPLDLNYLNHLEKEYGMPNLWPYIELDRVVRRSQLVREYPYDTPKYSHEEMMRLLQVKAKAILKFLEKERPDIIFLSVVADLGTLFLYNAAKKMNIKVLLLRSSRIGTLNTLTEDYKTLSCVEETFHKIQNKQISCPEHKTLANNFLESFRVKPLTYAHLGNIDAKLMTRRKQFSFLNPNKFITSLKWTFTVFADYFSNNHKSDPYLTKPWYYILDRLKRKFRVLVGFDDLYDEMNTQDDYAFFPLQVEPEMATSLFSQFYTDQLWLIKQVARALPINFKIYVKEHPGMYGYRPRSFYAELKKIPNLKLMRPAETGFNLIHGAKIIATLTGTTGWEGILFKKPVITFGDVFYNLLPMAEKCENINDLPRLIKKQLENFHYDEAALINLITSIYKESVDLDLIKLWMIEGGAHIEQHREQLAALTDFIAEKLNIKKV